MASFNKVLLMGNLTRDPQIKYLPNQTAVCQFGLASNRKFTTNGEQREEVLFVDCTAFGRQAEVIGEYCQKGKSILVEGRLKLDTWEDKNGGGKRSKHTVVVEHAQFLGGRPDGEGRGGGGDEEPAARQRPAPSGGSSVANRANRRADYSKAKPAPQASRAPVEDPIQDDEVFGEDDIPF